MTPRSVLSLVTKQKHKTRDEVISEGSAMSFRNVLQKSTFDFVAWQRSMPDRVAAYFRGVSASRIASEFGVSERTAQYWKDGIVVPNGGKIALIACNDPEGFVRHFTGEVAA
jgi:hypothetical protein